MAGTVRQFLRIAGTPLINEAWTPNISFTDTQVHTAPTSNVRYLIRDDHALIANSAAPKYPRINVRNMNYDDQGNAVGVYRPLVYRDVDGKEWQLLAGESFTPQHSSRKMDWSGTKSHVFETYPALMARDKMALTPLSLYLVRLPQDWLPFRASAWRMAAAMGAAGSANAYCYLALYTSDSNLQNAPLHSIDRGGITVASEPNVIKTADKTSTIATNPESNFYLGIYAGGTTGPEMWGMLSAQSPLLKRQDGDHPFLAGVVRNVAAIPDSITDWATIEATDFVPWMSLQPTTYV
jgi:hypothetical protein